MRLPVVLALLLLVAGCQPIPHPFADQAASSLPLKPRDSVGITVLPVAAAGAAEERPLTGALAKALIGLDVLASTDAANRGSYRLGTSVTAVPTSGERLHVTLNWQLSDAAGKKVGSGAIETDTPQAIWEAGDTALAASLAGDAAPKIAALIDGDQPPPEMASNVAQVVLRGVTGAPGDGNTSLAAAIVRALGRAGIAVASGNGDAPLSLAGAVEVSPAQDDKQQVIIRWQLSQRGGGVLGHADQQNAVPAGSLNGAWADIAFAVAAAAAPGIADLVHKAEPMVADQAATHADAPPQPPPDIPTRTAEAAPAPAKPAAPVPPPQVGVDGDQAEFLVQFGAYRSAAVGEKACAGVQKLAPIRLVRPASRDDPWYRCRTVSPRSRAAAEALAAAATAAGKSAVLVQVEAAR
jgi:cell division protein FtsN